MRHVSKGKNYFLLSMHAQSTTRALRNITNKYFRAMIKGENTDKIGIVFRRGNKSKTT
jgi:hypothetical protein